MKRKYTGILLMVLAAASLAVATILMKWIPQLTQLLPKDVAIWRFSIAAPLLWLVSIFRHKDVRTLPNRLWRFLVLGCIYALASFSAVFALDRLPSSIYVIIVYIYPSLVVLFSLVTGGKIPKLFWLGLPVTFLGLFLLVYEFGVALAVDPVGFFITLVNALAMGAYLLFSEKIFTNVRDQLIGTNWVITGAMFAGLIMIPFLGVNAPESAVSWILLLSLGIFGTMTPILAINFGLQFLGAARGSVIVTLQPVLAVLFSTLFLGETLTLQQWLGGLLVIIAVVILQLSGDKNGKLAENIQQEQSANY